MFDPPDVPGYDVLAPLGSTGRTWKAIAADGSRVVLRRVHGGETVRQRLRQAAALWGSVPGGHVVDIRDVITVEPDAVLVVSDYAPGGGLDVLLSRRGSLDDGEVVTIVAPLAETLAAAHERGLGHGRVSLGNVVFTEAGRPMLTDTSLQGGDPGACDADTAALASVARTALGDRRTGPVHDALAAAPASATGLAAALRAAAPARPVRLHDIRGTASASLVDGSRRKHLPLVGVVVVVAIALVAGVAWGRRDTAGATRLPVPATPRIPPSAAPAATEPSTEESASPQPQPWWGIMQRLDDARVRSYAAVLARRGLRPVGLDVRVQSVDVLSSSGDHAVIRVTDGWAAYVLVDGSGRVVSRRPARPHRVATLVLLRRSAGWQVERQLR